MAVAVISGLLILTLLTSRIKENSNLPGIAFLTDNETTRYLLLNCNAKTKIMMKMTTLLTAKLAKKWDLVPCFKDFKQS